MPMNSKGPHKVCEGRDEALAAAVPVQSVEQFFTPLDDECHAPQRRWRGWEGTTLRPTLQFTICSIYATENVYHTLSVLDKKA